MTKYKPGVIILIKNITKENYLRHHQSLVQLCWVGSDYINYVSSIRSILSKKWAFHRWPQTDGDMGSSYMNEKKIISDWSKVATTDRKENL